MKKICTYCGNLFTGQRESRKYCSDNCRQMAYYKRNGFQPTNGRFKNTVLQEQTIVKDTASTVKYVKRHRPEARPASLSGFEIDKPEYTNALECIKCLTSNLIALSEIKEITRESFLAVAETFDRLVDSPVFQILPDNFPYRLVILELQRKLRVLASENHHRKIIQFCLSDGRRSGLKAMLQTLDYVNDVKLDEVLL